VLSPVCNIHEQVPATYTVIKKAAAVGVEKKAPHPIAITQ
jgi:hypothetical protein